MRITYLLFIAMCIACTSTKESPNTVAPSEASSSHETKQLHMGGGMSSSLTKAVTLAISDIPYEDERRYGENIGLAMYATPGFGEPIMDEDLGLYINMLTNIIGRDSDRPGIIYHTAVIHSADKNVYAVPGGFIFITSGLILELDSEAQLAFALAHAVAAIAKKQAMNAMKKSQSLQALFAASEQLSQLDNISDEEFNAAVLQHKEQILTPEVVLQQQADMHGVEYVYDVGYDPRVALHVLDKIDISEEHKAERRKVLQYTLAQYSDFSSLVVKTGRLQEMQDIIRTTTK